MPQIKVWVEGIMFFPMTSVRSGDTFINSSRQFTESQIELISLPLLSVSRSLNLLHAWLSGYDRTVTEVPS